MKIIYLYSFVFLFVSCENPAKNKKENDKELPIKNKSSLTNCYKYTGQGDTIEMRLIHVGESVTGALVYKLKEKDTNAGTVRGFIRDSLFIADYTFMSEGVHSVRQVVFKIQGKYMVEGYGEVTERYGKVYFRNTDSLRYDKSVTIPEVLCP